MTLAILRRRERWNVTSPSTMASATYAASIIAAVGRFDSSFVNSLIRFRQLLDNGTLGIAVPPIPRRGHPADNAAIADFWIQACGHADADVRAVATEACDACSIPLSQASVESSFAILASHQADNTLLAGPRYLRNLAVLTVNRPYLVSMYEAPMRELAKKLGYA